MELADTSDPVTPEQTDEWLIKAENGSACASQEISTAYGKGLRVERDTEKSKYFYKLSQIITGCPTI